MPVTERGTVWSHLETTLANGDQALVAASDAVLTAGDPAPCVLYAHGNFGPYNQFLTQAGWVRTREWLIDNGWYWVEGRGGGSQWGSPRGVAAYELAHEWATTIIPASVTVGLLRSMGGCYARSFAESAVIDADGLILNSGVLDIAARGAIGEGDAPAIWSAFQAADHAEFLDASASFDPMQAPVGTWAGVEVLNMWGTADTTVAPAVNAEAWESAFSTGTERYFRDVKVGGDHSQGNGSYTQWEAMTAFLARFSGVAPGPVEPGVTFRRLARFVKDGPLQRLVTPLP